MARIEIEASPVHRGLHKEEYARLIHDLENEGHVVTLRPVEERRGVDEYLRPAYTVAVHLLDLLDEHAIDVVKAYVVARLVTRHHGRARPRGVIFGPDGERLREFDLPEARDD